MALIKLSTALKKELKLCAINKTVSTELQSIDFSKNKHIDFFIKDLKKLLDEDLFVHVKELTLANFDKHIFLAALVQEFGEYYGMVESTGIKIDCNYTGCSRTPIILHNDDAIDLIRQPKIGFIQVTKADPVNDVNNGIVLIRDLVNFLKYESPTLLNDLLTIPIPMLSFGVNFDGSDKNEILTTEPILREECGKYLVRFDFYRNKFFYKFRGIKQDPMEKKLIYDFIKNCEIVKKSFNLDLNDIFIFNNHETVHDRGECSIEYGLDGLINSREIIVSFAR